MADIYRMEYEKAFAGTFLNEENNNPIVEKIDMGAAFIVKNINLPGVPARNFSEVPPYVTSQVQTYGAGYDNILQSSMMVSLAELGFPEGQDVELPVTLAKNEIGYDLIPIEPKDPLFLTMSSQGGATLDFEWANRGALYKVYDLECVESLTNSNWQPYYDGVTTYAEIPADESGTNMLTGVLAPGTQAFFRLLEKAPPIVVFPYLAFDDFSTYTDGAVNGQAGSPFGFSGTWTATAASISGGVLTQTGAAGVGDSATRSMYPYASSGTIYIRANMELGTASIASQNSFFILSPDPTLSPNIICQGGDFLTGVSQFRLMGDNGANIGNAVGVNDGGMHTWLIELNLDTGACTAWVDPDINAFDRSNDPMTASTAGTAFGQITVQTFGAGSRVELDNIKVGPTLESIGVTER